MPCCHVTLWSVIQCRQACDPVLTKNSQAPHTPMGITNMAAEGSKPQSPPATTPHLKRPSTAGGRLGGGWSGDPLPFPRFSSPELAAPGHEPSLQAAVRAAMGRRAAGWRHGLLLALLALTAFAVAGECMVGVGARPGVQPSPARRESRVRGSCGPALPPDRHDQLAAIWAALRAGRCGRRG